MGGKSRRPTEIRPFAPGPPPEDAQPLATVCRSFEELNESDPGSCPSGSNCRRWAGNNVWSWRDPNRKGGRLVRPKDLLAVYAESQERNVEGGRTGKNSLLPSAWLSDTEFAKASGLAVATVRTGKSLRRFHEDPEFPVPLMTRGIAWQIRDEREAAEQRSATAEPGRPGRKRPDNRRTNIRDQRDEIALANDILALKKAQGRVYDGETMDRVARQLMALLSNFCNGIAQQWPAEFQRIIHQHGGRVPDPAVTAMRVRSEADAADLLDASVKALRSAADEEEAKDRLAKLSIPPTVIL